MATPKRWREYQGLDDIKGRRDTAQRIEELGILEYVREGATLLDIGCNRGLFCIVLSPKVKYATGVEPIPENVAYGKDEITKRGITNCELIKSPFTAGLFKEEQFDIILSLSVHAYIDMSMEDYASELWRISAPDGILILEGHQKAWQMDEGRKTWPALLNALSTKFERLKKYTIKDRPGNMDRHDRPVRHWRRKDAV